MGDEGGWRAWVSFDAGCDVRAYSAMEMDTLVRDEIVMFDAVEEIGRGAEMGAI